MSLHSLSSAEMYGQGSLLSLRVGCAAGLVPGAHLTGCGTCLLAGRTATWVEVAA